MNQDQVIICCDKHTSLNTHEKVKKECPSKKDVCATNPCGKPAECDQCKKFEPCKAECEKSRTGKLSGCCLKSPECGAPTKRCTNTVICLETATATAIGCDDEPVSYKSFVQEKMEPPCECVKFNGLQDTCGHPNCCTKDGCLNIPFPTCPPAQKWHDKYICKNNKNNGCT